MSTWDSAGFGDLLQAPLLKPRSFDLVAATREDGDGAEHGWGCSTHRSSASMMDMRSGSLIKKGEIKRGRKKEKKVLQCFISPARSCRVVICCLGTLWSKSSSQPLSSAITKSCPLTRLTICRPENWDTKETARIMHLINLYITNIKGRYAVSPCLESPGYHSSWKL